MKNTSFEDTISILVGILMILFRNFLSRKTMESQNALWNFTFGAREIEATKFVIIIVGIFFIILGMFSLLSRMKS